MPTLSDWLFCRCLGDRCCGLDLDSTFAYQTPKVVKIQDRTLGLLRIGLMLAIFVYIVVFNMWYKGQHFLMSDVNGIFRLQWQEPVRHKCNPLDIDCDADFQSTTELPYCKDFSGPASDVELTSKTCAFYDARELPVNLLGGVLIPTRIKTFRQVRNCQDESQNCRRKYSYVDAQGKVQQGKGEAMPVADNFVVDIEDFTMLVDHSFSTANGKVKLDDYNMQGYWKPCPGDDKRCERKQMICAHDSCSKEQDSDAKTMFTQMRALRSEVPEPTSLNHSRHRRAPAASFTQLSMSTEAETLENRSWAGQLHRGAGVADHDGEKGEKVLSIEDGDVFSLKNLLAMAGMSLDDVTNTESVRDRGSAIVVKIQYNNMHPWQLLQPQNPPEYTVSVTRRPVMTFKQTDVVSEDADGRVLQIKYGVYIIIQQVGRIGTFDAVNLLITLAAATTLLAVSNVLTDMLALYALPRKEIYTELKYEVSDDHLGSKKAYASESEKPATQSL
eukprot:TRINITY_DN25210_c0_g1_i1.p1 TRINITY_DN25210_c0_g1~~TRINITY_DN25210_c0_g1_i1.p1  ORF type:complete len:500 (-),score=73.04 TRINITY_DN25210_c0_g1_i1:120-1619(-)